MIGRFGMLLSVCASVALTGCQAFVDNADQQVYKLIEERQREALALESDATIDKERVPKKVPGSAYDYVPSPVDSEVPEAMRSTSRPSTQPMTPPSGGAVPGPSTAPAGVTRMTLEEGLSYAFHHARRFQTAKEDLYLAALALTLERHMWGPRFMGDIQLQYANYGQIRDFDHAMAAVAQVAVEQRLPYGGEVTAKVINTLMRDLGRRITTNESGQAIIEANVPLLRGAGRVARESRYQAERNLIYAARTFERFRRTFVVDVANTYFSLLLTKQQIANAKQSYRSFLGDTERSKALFEAGRIMNLDAQRAEQRLLSSWNQVVVAEESYQRGLDQFKILIGMPAIEPLDVADSEFDLKVPVVGEETLVEIAVANRLDLINERDAIDDARRGVKVAQNGLLPDLNLRGNVTWDTNPNEFNQYHYEYERTTWRAFMDLELPLDRMAERNRYRASLIDLRRSQRRYDLAADEVRAEVRQARRQIELALTTLSIQRQSMELALRQREAADFRFNRGVISNRDVVEAEDNLLQARNALAQAERGLRQGILQFYLDAGMIRVSDDGKLLDFEGPNR
ncbi:MAG: TolC family protein [Phycisphaerae bacterium]|nr:TolC family protein [Phycisphaerae bacterium]